MTDLLALAAQIEAADGPSRELDFLIHNALRSTKKTHHTKDYKPRNAKAFTSSIDAALALVPEGWVIGSLDWWPTKRRTGVTLLEAGQVGDWYGYDAEIHRDSRATAATPALSLCAAALKARAGAA